MRKRSEAGFALLENIVAIAIVSVLLLGVIAGFLTSVAVTGRTGDRADAAAALDSVAEQVPRLTYRACGSLAQIRGDLAAIGAPPAFEVHLAAVAYLQADGSFGTTCSSDRGAQRLSLAVHSTAGTASARGQVVIRNPAARP